METSYGNFVVRLVKFILEQQRQNETVNGDLRTGNIDVKVASITKIKLLKS